MEEGGHGRRGIWCGEARCLRWAYLRIERANAIHPYVNVDASTQAQWSGADGERTGVAEAVGASSALPLPSVSSAVLMVLAPYAVLIVEDDTYRITARRSITHGPTFIG